MPATIRHLTYAILFAVAMTAICGCPTESPPPAPEPIRVGAVYPFTGPGAASAGDIRSGLELAAAIINESVDLAMPMAGEKGIPSLGGRPIQLFFRDSKGDEMEAARQVEDLVNTENVAAVMGCYNSNVTAAASEQAEIMRIPFLNTTSTSPLLTRRGLKWFFRTTPDDAMFAANFFTFFSDLAEKGTARPGRRLILVYENRLWGTSVAREERRRADQEGYEVAADIPYDAKDRDFGGPLARIRESLPGIILQTSYAEDAAALVQGYKTEGIAPEAVLGMNAGFISPLFLETLGPDADGILTRDVWALDLGGKKPLAAAVNARFRNRFGTDMTGNSSRAFTGLMVLGDALNRASDLSKDRIRTALAETDIPGDATIMPWEGIRFNPETGQNTRGRGIIAQVQGGTYHTVWPWDLADRSVIWPLPARWAADGGP